MKKYPVYRLSATWTQDGKNEKDKYPESRMYKDMPEGKIRNSSGSTRMFKEPPSDEELADWKVKFEDAIRTDDSRKEDGKRHKNLTDYTSEIECKGEDSWCLTWFSHYTFDTGQSDEDVLKSFQDFVDEKISLNSENGHWNNEHNLNIDYKKHPYYCLMGAEDRWRWSGSKDDAKNIEDNTTEAPCRCVHCKKQGVIRINH